VAMRNDFETSVILDSLAYGVLAIDLDYNITFFNRAAERITGVPREQAVGRKCHEVMRFGICGEACAFARTLEGRECVIDKRVSLTVADGEVLPVGLKAGVLYDQDGQAFGGVETFRDLSAMELPRRLAATDSHYDIISRDAGVLRILQFVPDIAASGSNVLIEGPSGSGKELFARAIHGASERAEGKFVAVNCGALPDNLLESELFGYVKGAFTDARRDKPGRFAAANGGTIFLDEIGDVSPAVQVKLLRVIQEREYEPLGTNHSVKVNARIIAATNKPLKDLMVARKFREDLYYRLNVVNLKLPSLAERREDIPLLAEHFVSVFNDRTSKTITGFSDEAMRLLREYSFPGNIRELENVVEYAFVICKSGAILPEHLPLSLRSPVVAFVAGSPLEDAELVALKAALAANDGKRGETARSLGVHKATLWRKMRKHGLL